MLLVTMEMQTSQVSGTSQVHCGSRPLAHSAVWPLLGQLCTGPVNNPVWDTEVCVKLGLPYSQLSHQRPTFFGFAVIPKSLGAKSTPSTEPQVYSACLSFLRPLICPQLEEGDTQMTWTPSWLWAWFISNISKLSKNLSGQSFFFFKRIYYIHSVLPICMPEG